MTSFEKAQMLLYEFKGSSYLQGAGVISQVGAVVASLGGRPALVTGRFLEGERFRQRIRQSVAGAGTRAPRSSCPR